MKVQKNLIVSLIAVVLTVGLILNFGGCANESPLAAEDKGLSNQSELNFIPREEEGSPSLNKIIQVSDWVTKEDGGILKLEYKLRGKRGWREKLNRPIQVVVTLQVLPHSISEDA